MDNWADQGVLKAQIQDPMHVFSVCVGIFPASFGPFLIYKAFVVRIQERARSGVQDIIPLFVSVQVLFDKFGGFYSENSGKPIDIRL
jgi:hypothetical protein